TRLQLPQTGAWDEPTIKTDRPHPHRMAEFCNTIGANRTRRDGGNDANDPLRKSECATWDDGAAILSIQWAGVAPPPRRPATARSESRGLRKREGAVPASPASPR